MQRWRLAAAVVGERCFTTIMLLVNILGGYPDGSEVNYYGLSVVKTSGREKKRGFFVVMRWMLLERREEMKDTP